MKKGKAGFVAWRAWEVRTGATMSIGRKEVDNIEVESFDPEQGGGRVHLLHVPLSSSFRLALVRTVLSEPAPISGFGFTASREDVVSFTWEWFRVVDPTTAVKLQETGRLAIEMVDDEVRRTEFLSDVSLRVIEPTFPFIFRPKWRLEILEGSWLRWPSTRSVDPG